MQARIASLHIYPLKSARGIALPATRLGEAGFEWDRHWMLVDADGRFLSQRRIPQMALLTTRFEDGVLEVGFPNREPLRISSAPPVGELISATMHRADEHIPVVDNGDAAADWFAVALGDKWQPRLVHISPEHRRTIPDGVPGRVELADGYPYLITSNASLALLNDQLLAAGIPEAPITMDRFRPNIVLDLPEPWVEMQTGSLLRGPEGEAILELAKPCQRCTVPQVDPGSGERDLGAELHRALTGLSERAPEQGNHFGQNAVPRGAAGTELRVGGELTLEGAGAT